MNNTGYIEGGVHAEVVSLSAANLFVVAHYADFCLPEFYAKLLAGISELFTCLPHIRYGGIGPVAMGSHQMGNIGQIAYVG